MDRTSSSVGELNVTTASMSQRPGLVILALHISVEILSCILFGGGIHAYQFSWFAMNSGYYFTFIGSYIASATYLLNSYSGKDSPMLVIICALQGFIGFGKGFGMGQFIDTA